jgi:hypothetical protein
MEARMDRLSSFNNSPIYDGKSLKSKMPESNDSTNIKSRIKDVFEKQHFEGKMDIAKDVINHSDSETSDSVELFDNSPIQPVQVKKTFLASDESAAKIGIDRFKNYNKW